jgi:hypothetical protein
LTISPPPGISRSFRDLSDKDFAQTEGASQWSRWGRSPGFKWDDLLKARRILMVSEAGAGKTYECQACQKRLWDDGEAAFFLELAILADKEVGAMLGPDEQVRFDQWRRSQSERATFFLDSIDELKITQKSFEQALKPLARACAGNMGRVRVVITTRPIPLDRQLIETHLAIPPEKEADASAESFADTAMHGKRSQKDDSEAVKEWRNVGLMPLAPEEIKAFAVTQGVQDPEALLTDIRKRDAEDYAQRPQDLIELCADWKDHHGIRSHGEQVETNVINKLKPRDRKEKAQLSAERAQDGASRLALAALLTRKFTIRYSAESDTILGTDPALDAGRILTGWSQPEQQTLLERPLFGFANYGRVRFHHRSVLEYLAAKRLGALLKRGVPIRAVKRILFTETAQGEKAVRPSMRPAAAWLSAMHDGIFDEALKREPDVLLDHGDPQSLSPARRAQILKAYAARYGKGKWRGLSTQKVQVHRFASSELGPTVRELWSRGLESPELRELMFELIGAGRMTDCADIAHDMALNPAGDHRERRDALEALITLDDPRLHAIASSIVSDATVWPEGLTRSALMMLFPQHLSVEQLCKALARVREPSRSVGDLSWLFPRLITEKDVSIENLDKLRAGLTELVLKGAEWKNSEWPHTRTKRPDLIPALLAACNRQFRDGVTSAALYRSSVLVLRFTKSDHIQDQAAKELRAFLAKGTAAQRETAFWEDDSFMQALHPQTDAWHRVFHVSHYGGIHLDPEKDRDWVIRRLSDRTAPLADREMMLYSAMIDLLRQGDDVRAFTEGLKAYVADAPALMAVIDNRLAPSPDQERMRQFGEEDARRKREREKKESKARESWVKFGKKVATQPDVMFDESHADGTASDLWRVMEQSGTESRASGWNRKFIERQFGRDVADRLRMALQRLWRKFTPTLRSERPADKKNTFLVRWQLGLAGIYAEAEDDAWATKLGEDEAQLAARYAPIQLNGFPSWLEALAAVHAKAIDDTLGVELSLSLLEPAEGSNATLWLQDVRYASPAVARLFIPRVKKWLDDVLNGRIDKVAAPAERVSQAVEILMQSDDLLIRAGLAETAANQITGGITAPTAKIWLPILMQLDPQAGVSALENGLAGIQPAARGPAIEWFSLLFNQDRRGGSANVQRPEFTPDLLLRLARLAYRHVRPGDDVPHEGAYSPDDRDFAERARSALLTAVLAAPGAAGWKAKLELAADRVFEDLKDRAMVVARERAAEEAEGPPFAEAEVVALDTYGETPPTTRDAMFAIMRDRLEDIDDLLLQDVSPREAWANIAKEHLMRRELARELRSSANSMYTVDQEAATADEKETDIRLRATRSSQHATIELKIGEKPRSAAVLRRALKDQLMKKYMAAEDCRAGCLVVTIRSNKTWAHPDSGVRLDLAGLIAMLNEEAAQLTAELGGSIRLMAKGLDLRPRLKTERAATAKKRTPRKPTPRKPTPRKPTPKTKRRARNRSSRNARNRCRESASSGRHLGGHLNPKKRGNCHFEIECSKPATCGKVFALRSFRRQRQLTERTIRRLTKRMISPGFVPSPVGCQIITPSGLISCDRFRKWILCRSSPVSGCSRLA